MNISSNTLFHFTQDKSTLESILTNNFWPCLSIEENNILEGDLSKIAIPMVCFCDIPLGNINRHMRRYGNYAIGLKYSWAKSKGLNPVWYLNFRANVLKSLWDIYGHLDVNDLTYNDGTPRGNKLMYPFCFIKKFSSKQMDNISTDPKHIRYYDEREWRYVPKLFENGKRVFLSYSEYNDTSRRERVTRILRNNPLCFTPSDINYIIVKNDEELLYMKHFLERTKSAYSQHDREILVTKLISAQRIKNDF